MIFWPVASSSSTTSLRRTRISSGVSDEPGNFELDLSSFKHCVAHLEHMMKRPSVQKLLAFEKSMQAEFAKAA